MSETALLSTLLAACFALIGAIYALMNGRHARLEASHTRQGERLGSAESALAALRTQNERQERDVTALQAQNATQETAIAALVQRMIAREDAHAQHREDMGANFSRLETQIAGLGTKIDQLIRGGKTPWPTDYSRRGEGGGGERK